MTIATVRDLLARHSFFAGLPDELLDLLAGCARNAAYGDGSYVFHEGAAADNFFLVRSGSVAVEIHVPARGPLVIDTLREGEVLGWSWFFAPYQWEFDARAIGAVTAVSLDGACLRAKCDEDTRLGYEVAKRLADVIQRRLRSARIRLVDLYGAPNAR